VESYRELIVWQRAIQMTLAVYRLTASFPKEELFGLTSQMRRAGISVATHIAEGYGRNSPADYKHLLGMARGSNLELQTQLVIVAELAYVDPVRIAEVESLSTEVAKMLNSLIHKL
jgi:four helix bundle protein